jgi:hypothetical protein
MWPPEEPSEYAGRTGYWAACAVRAMAFALVFLPATAIVAAPCNLAAQVRDAATAPARLWRRLTGRGAAADCAVLPPPLGRSAAARSHATPVDGGRDWPVLEGARRRLFNR